MISFNYSCCYVILRVRDVEIIFVKLLMLFRGLSCGNKSLITNGYFSK